MKLFFIFISNENHLTSNFDENKNDIKEKKSNIKEIKEKGVFN